MILTYLNRDGLVHGLNQPAASTCVPCYERACDAFGLWPFQSASGSAMTCRSFLAMQAPVDRTVGHGRPYAYRRRLSERHATERHHGHVCDCKRDPAAICGQAGTACWAKVTVGGARSSVGLAIRTLAMNTALRRRAVPQCRLS